MPYVIDIDGMEEVIKQLADLGESAEPAASYGLFEGAAIIANAVNKAAKNIKTAPFDYAKSGEMRLPSPEEKKILTDDGAMGIARFRHEGGGVNTSVGYNKAGYANVDWNHMSSSARTNYKAVRLKNHDSNASSFLKALRKAGGGNIGRGAQNQKPIGVIANSINSGTSFMKKQPFIRKGVMAGQADAVKAIIAGIERYLNEILKKTG